MTNQRVLHALLLTALNQPTFDTKVDDWLLAHNLIEINGVGGSVSLTVTGTNLLNNTIQMFGETLENFHNSGQLNGATKEDHNTNEQTRPISKGKARKELKK